MKDQPFDRARVGRCAAVCAAGLLAASQALAQSGFLAPLGLRVNDSAQDLPHIATDGNGVWVATWTSNESLLSPLGLIGLDDDVLSSRSLDGGRSWSPPVVVNPDDAVLDDPLALAPELNVRTAGDGQGNWIAVWESEAPILGKGILAPPERDVRFARSNDAAATWSGPFNLEDFTGGALNTHGVTDRNPQIVFAGDGVWLLVWSAEDGDLALTGPDADIFALRSADGGVLWTGFQPVNVIAEGDSGDDTRPALAADGAGTAVVVWESTETSLMDQPIGPDADILAAASNDYGVTWSAPWLLSADGADDGLDERKPAVAGDGKGNWVAVWESASSDDGAGNDIDIRAARSTNNGITWSETGWVNDYNAEDGEDDGSPVIATDGFGAWICLWTTAAQAAGAGPDEDVVYALSYDNGATWTEARLADEAAAGPEDRPIDGAPSVAADRAGNWAAVWTKADILNLLTRPGVVGARGEFTGGLSGRVSNGPYGLSCAAVVAVNLDTGVERRAVTDANGLYALPNLPVGLYRVAVYAPEHGGIEAEALIAGGDEAEQDFALLRTPLEGGVFGQVIDAGTGQPPLVSVKVEAFIGDVPAATTYTCAAGFYQLAIPPLKGGAIPVEVRFTQSGYLPESEDILVEPPANTELDVNLEKAIPSPSTLAGIIRSGTTNAPIAGARVTLDGRVNMSTAADTNGVYLFPAIPEGVYAVHASAKRFKGVTVTAAIGPAPTQVEIALESDPAAEPNRADINGDETINAIDIQLVINGALGFQTGYIVDLNDDGTANAIDVQAAILAALSL